LQKHKDRDEWWKMISGNGTVTIGDEKKDIVIGETCFVPRGELHQVEAGTLPVVLLEIAFGVFDEGDIVRINDRYGRT